MYKHDGDDEIDHESAHDEYQASQGHNQHNFATN